MEFKDKVCVFCGSDSVFLQYPASYHPVVKSWGPFDIYRCRKCASLFTNPLPTASRLSGFYSGLEGGIQADVAAIRKTTPLTAWYRQCIRSAMKKWGQAETSQSFRWLDVAAGNGELSRLMLEMYPGASGVAVDLHQEPKGLEKSDRLRWIKSDLNEWDTSLLADERFDVIFGVSILEHILHPAMLVSKMLKLAAPGSVLYLAAPDTRSWAAGILRKKWPYFLPGEHLNMPSVQGMTAMLNQCLLEAGKSGSGKVTVNSIRLNYPVNYLLNYFRIPFPGKFFSDNFTVGTPSGALEGIVSIF